MKTLRCYADTGAEPAVLREVLGEGARLLRAGELVAFPTETVYGLGANVWNAEACARIFAVKGRPADNPLIVHVASVEEAENVVSSWPRRAQQCAEMFWPGPLTLVLPRNPAVPEVVTAGGGTVAVRVPGHPVARMLIALTGCPVAAPSANISGRPSPTQGDHVWEDLEGKIPLLIDAGPCRVGMESTVLDLSGEVPVMLRPGGVSWEALCDVLGEVKKGEGCGDLSGGDGVYQGQEISLPRSPGMKYRHYAPKALIEILSGPPDERVRRIAAAALEKKEPLALLCFERTKALMEPWVVDAFDYMWAFPDEDGLRDGAAGLFAALRTCDRQGIALILAEESQRSHMGRAYMNRLEKAARRV